MDCCQLSEEGVTVIERRLGSCATVEEATVGFHQLVSGIWEALEPVIDKRACHAVLAHALKKTARRHPILDLVTVADGGLDLGVLRTQLATGSEDLGSLRAAFVEMGRQVFTLLTDLADDVLAARVRHQLREQAEQWSGVTDE